LRKRYAADIEDRVIHRRLNDGTNENQTNNHPKLFHRTLLSI